MKRNIQQLTWIIACGFLFLTSCKKNGSEPTPTPDPGTTGNAAVDSLLHLNIPASFNYETYKNVTLDITILAPDNTPINNIPISIMTKSEDLGGVALYKSLTDDYGKISGLVKLPSYIDELVVDARYLGVPRNAAVSISASKVTCTLGGIDGYSGNVILNSPLTGGKPAKEPTGGAQRPLVVYSYMGAFDNQGRPKYLESKDKTISKKFLADINASLPEGKPVTTYHPDYLLNAVETNANVTALSDVSFTFITEGTSYKNAIAYFTYPTNNPPQTPSQIDSLHIILPNASMPGSGGTLKPGSTVKLGRFNPGTSIGFALIANGWTGSTVGGGNWILYSLDNLNPQTSTTLKKQSVFLYDNTQEAFLIGFEDIRRDNSSCDHDFNDCMFYLQSNPVTAISKTKVNPVDTPKDADGDGVTDVADDFPNDATRAYINYYPGERTMGTLAFEDNWPYLGDYDMNDLVVGYRYSVVSDALNRVIDLKAKYLLKASGAKFRNGFGIEFPFLSSLVKSATGSLVTNSQVVTLGANGCETGQTKAVIIPFDDAFTVMNSTTGFINTYSVNPFVGKDTILMNLSFTRPLLQSEFGTAPFNPFIIIDRTRGREAHLPGYTPTAKIDTKLYKTGVDNTIPAQNNYFKTNTNLPWAVAFTEQFSYPQEGKTISTVYTKFMPWVQSGGTISANWYNDSLNMVNSLIYKH